MKYKVIHLDQPFRIVYHVFRKCILEEFIIYLQSSMIGGFEN